VANTTTPSEIRAINGRKGGARVQSPEYLALRLVKGWPELTEEQRDLIRGLLRPLIVKHRATPAK
jgi:hypothetical protein